MLRPRRLTSLSGLIALGLTLGSATAQAGIDPGSGSIVLENAGTLELQIVRAAPQWRSVLSLHGLPITSPADCGAGAQPLTYGGAPIESCVFDTGYCSGEVDGLACPFDSSEFLFTCDCMTSATYELGDFAAGEHLDFWLYVDVQPGSPDDDVHVWKPSGTTNPNPDGFAHLRTTELTTDSYLLEWEDASGGGDGERNALVALARVKPPSCFVSGSNPSICNTTRFFPGLPQVRAESRVIVDEVGVSGRSVKTVSKLYNFGPSAAKVALCPTLRVPSDAASSPSETAQALSYLDDSGIPECNDQTVSGPPTIGFSSVFYDAATPANICDARQPSDDYAYVQGVNAGGPGRADFAYAAPVSVIDQGIANLDNKLYANNASQIWSRISTIDSPTVSENLFYEVGDHFSCVSGSQSTFVDAPAAVPAIVAKLAARADSYPFALDADSPATFVVSTTPPGYEDPTAAPVEVVMDLLWSDNVPLLDPTHEHLSGILESSLPRHTPFMAGGSGTRSGEVTAVFPNALPEGFQATLTAVLRQFSDGKPLLTTTVTFARDHTPPTVHSVATERTETGIAVTAVGSDAAAGLGQAELLPTENGASLLPVAMTFGSGDFYNATQLLGALAATPSKTLGLDLGFDDASSNATVVPQIPVANSGGNRVAECASPSGAQVSLDGTKSTGQALSYTWSGPFGVVSGVMTTQHFDFGDNLIRLDVTDARGFTGRQASIIRVGDTTGPLFVSKQATPSCIWPPTGKMVAYQLGGNLPVSIADTCDPNPSVRIVYVTDNLGNSVPTNGAAFCVSAKKDRVYTVTFEARDNSGNTSTAALAIPVTHTGCSPLDPALFLEADDPACQL